jgi:HK97 family phage portal protein
MGFKDLFRSKARGFNIPNISLRFNSSGEWLFDNDNKNDSYINNGFKELPNVYGLIMAILKKSTIVPFEVYQVKSRANEQKYKALMQDPKNVLKALKYKALAYDKVEDSELEQLLLDPNTYQTNQELNYEIDGYKLLTGNSYAYTPKVGNKPKEIHNVPSPFVEMIVKGQPFSPEFTYQLSYLEQTIGAEEMLHFKYWSPVLGTKSPSNQYYGQSPLQACRMLLGRYKDADLTQGFMFKNQGPGGLLTGEKDTDLTQEQAISLQDRFRQQHMGVHKANDVIITPSKLSWTAMGLSPVDLNITEAKKEIVNELCNAYNYPSELFGGDKKYNNFEQARRAALTDGVIPLVEARKDVFNKFLAPSFGNLRIEYDYTVFHELQEDLEAQAKTASTMYWISTNEKRAMTGYDDRPEPEANELLIPSGLSKLTDVAGDMEEINEPMLDPEADEQADK